MIDGGSERRVRSGKVELAAYEAGTPGSVAIVFVHGYPDTKEMWAPVLARLAPRFHVIAYDVRGAGASSAPRGPVAYDRVRLADDLDAVIDAFAPGRPVHFVGHDWGGIAGWEFATMPRFDAKVVSLTTIAGPSLDQIAMSLRQLRRDRNIRLDRRAAELVRRLYRSWYVIALCAPGLPTLMWRAMQSPRLAGLARAPAGIPAAPDYPTPALPDTARHGVNLYRRNILLRGRRRQPLPARMPVQLIVPTGDRFISESYYGLAERYAPSLRRRSIESSHWAPREQPELIAEWIAEFVEEVART